MEIDETVLKLLISGTKRNILKSLSKRRKMLTELSRELSLSMPTLLEHLNSLSKANLVIKREEGRKWKYYELTNRGKTVVNPNEPLKLALVFTLPAILIIAGLLASSPVMIQKDIVHTLTYETVDTIGRAPESGQMATAGATQPERDQQETLITDNKTTTSTNVEGDESQILSKGLIVSGVLLLAILLLLYIRSKPNLKKLFK